MNNEQTEEEGLPANFLEILTNQNFYVRLGLRTNQVDLKVIAEAWTGKRTGFEQARLENVITYEQYGQAVKLLDEAYILLSDSVKRKAYDKALYAAMKKTKKDIAASPSDVFASRYRIESVVQEGRRAKLYEARDLRIDRKVLIKELHSAWVRTDEQIQRFRDECGFYAGSNATHLVKVLDYDEKSFRVVMEWLPDHMGHASRKRWTDEQDFSPNEIREFLRQCLRGLQVLHSRGWVHGRLSPSHLLLDDHGNIKLSITPGLRESSIATAPTSDITHIAPEMLRPDVFGPVTPASDLYVLGFIALDLITRNKVVDRIDATHEETASEQERWYRWHASPVEILPSAAEWMHGIPEDLVGILEMLTNKQLSKRPLNAGAALKTLEELASGAGASAFGSGSPVSQHDCLPDDFGAVHLGAPPSLHDAQYSEPTKGAWQEFKQLSRDWVNANPKRKWLAIGSVLAASLLLISALKPSPGEEDIVVTKLVSEKEEPLVLDDGESVIRFPIADRNEGLDEDAEDPEGKIGHKNQEKRVADKPAEKPSRLRDVTIEIEGSTARVSVLDHKPVAAIDRRWQLEPGQYTATVEYGNDQSRVHRFRVPEGQGPYTLSIVLPTGEPVVESVTESPKWQPKSFRADIEFDIVGVAQHDYIRADQLRETAYRLINYLSYGNERTKPKLAAVEYVRNRDPRISLLLAVQAYRDNKLDDASKLCEESIAVLETNEVPFVLPYQLLVHIHDAKGVAKIQNSLTITSNSIFKLHQRYLKTREEHVKRLIAEQLWVFGKVVKHAEESTTQNVLALIDSSKYLELLALNEQFEDNPFEQGIAEYESRLEGYRPHWIDLSVESGKHREELARTSAGNRSSKGNRTARYIDYLRGPSDATAATAPVVDNLIYPQPGRALREQMNRRALSMDHDLSFVVSRVQLTLPVVPNRAGVSSVVIDR
jgi:serine/threonine protein kinase